MKSPAMTPTVDRSAATRRLVKDRLAKTAADQAVATHRGCKSCAANRPSAIHRDRHELQPNGDHWTNRMLLHWLHSP